MRATEAVDVVAGGSEGVCGRPGWCLLLLLMMVVAGCGHRCLPLVRNGVVCLARP